ncbi:MAG: AEC family transporter [Coprococcus sp.]
MELSILLAEQIFSLLLMVLTGYVVRKLNVVPKSGRKVLASIVLYVSAPCIVFDSFQIEYSSEKLFGLVVGFAAACIALAVFIWARLLCARRFFICQLQNRHRLLMRIQAI